MIATTKIPRRSFIAGGAVALAVAGAGLGWLSGAFSKEMWIESVVRENLRGVHIDEASLRQFITTMAQSSWFAPASHRLAIAAERIVPWIVARVPKVNAGLNKLERRVLTEFLLGSNFFRVRDPKQETIVYYGPAIACGNPFVSFS